MGWMETIGDAVQYIEENITQELTPERIAKLEKIGVRWDAAE